MASMGTLTIEMAANITRLQKDMDDAKASVGGAMESIQGAIDKTMMALGALGFVTTISGLKDLMTASIDAAAELFKLSEKTGVAVESLSAMKSAAKLSGTSIDEVGAGLVKLSKNMVDAQSGTGKAAETFAALGVTVLDTSGKMKTSDQVMLEVATSLSHFEQGATTTAAATNLLGKAGADLIPFLIQLAERGDLNGKVTTEQAKQAHDYEIEMAKLKITTDGYVRSLALELVPALLKATELFKPLVEVTLALVGVFYVLPALMTAGASAIEFLAGTTVEAAGGVTLLNSTLMTIGPTFDAMALKYGLFQTVVMSGLGVMVAGFAGWKLGEWLNDNFVQARLLGIAFVDGTMTALEYLIYGGKMAALAFTDAWQGAYALIGEGLAWVLDKVGEGMKLVGLVSAGSAITAFADSVRNVTANTIDFDTESKKLGDQLDVNVKGVHAITDSMADDAIAHFNTSVKVKEHTDILKLNTGAIAANTDAIDHAAVAGRAYAIVIQDMNEKLQLEADQGHKVTAAQQEVLKLDSDLASGKITLTAAMEAATRARITENAALTLQIEEQKQDTAENAKAVDAVYAQTIATLDQTQKLKDQREMMGLTTYDQNTLTQQRMLDKAAILDQKAAILEAGGPVTAMSQQYRDQADAVRGLAAEMNAVEWAKITKQIGDGLSSALVDAINNGKSLWLTFRNYMVTTILDGVIKNAFSSVIQAGINSSLSSLGVSTAAGGSGGAAGAASTGSSLLSGASAVGSLATGSMSLGNAAGSVAANAGYAGGGIDGLLATNGAYGTATAVGATGAGSAVLGGATVETGMTMGSAAAMDAGYGAVGVGSTLGGSEIAAGISAGPLGWAVLGIAAMFALNGGSDYTLHGEEKTTFGPDGAAKSSGKGGTLVHAGVPSEVEQMYLGEAAKMGVAKRAVEFDYTEFYNGNIEEARILVDGNDMGIIVLNDPASLESSKRQAALAAVTQQYPSFEIDRSQLNGFASGGDHAGGIRLVGEQGPELEVTGPSRIFNADQTASMLRSGGANGSELLDELRLLREEMRGLRASTERGNQNTLSAADSLRGRQSAPLLVQVVTS